jgi:hypothetical protein
MIVGSRWSPSRGCQADPVIERRQAVITAVVERGASMRTQAVGSAHGGVRQILRLSGERSNPGNSRPGKASQGVRTAVRVSAWLVADPVASPVPIRVTDRLASHVGRSHSSSFKIKNPSAQSCGALGCERAATKPSTPGRLPSARPVTSRPRVLRRGKRKPRCTDAGVQPVTPPDPPSW